MVKVAVGINYGDQKNHSGRNSSAVDNFVVVSVVVQNLI